MESHCFIRPRLDIPYFSAIRFKSKLLLVEVYGIVNEVILLGPEERDSWCWLSLFELDLRACLLERV